MTDTHSNIQNNTPEPQSMTNDESDNTLDISSISQSIVSDDHSYTTETHKGLMKKVDIVLAGVTYPIYCPMDEEQELHSAVYELNNFMLDLKKQAPNQSQENILVLCCLDLYEKINAQKRIESKRLEQSRQTDEMLNKIIKDAQSIR